MDSKNGNVENNFFGRHFEIDHLKKVEKSKSVINIVYLQIEVLFLLKYIGHKLVLLHFY